MTLPNLPADPRPYHEALDAEVRSLSTRMSEAEEGASQYATEMSALAARVAALEVAGPDPVPPPPKSTTMFGAGLYYSTKGTTYDQEWALHLQHTGIPTIVRIFATANGFNWSWPNVPSRQKVSAPGVTSTWVSFKPTAAELTSIASGSLNAKITAMVNTFPADHTHLMTLWHEPEDNAASGEMSFETWLRANIAMGEAVNATGKTNVKFGPVFMGSWYINGVTSTNKGHLPTLVANAKAWGLYDRWVASVDYVGWDVYHMGSESGKIAAPRDDPAYYFQPSLDFTTQHFPGKPQAVGELGFVAQGTPGETEKVAWLNRAVKWCRDNGFLAVCYYDAMLTTPWYLTFVKDTATIDTASTAAWGANY